MARRTFSLDQEGVFALCLINGLLATECRANPDKGGANFFRSRSPWFKGRRAVTLERTPGERPGDNEKSTLEVPSVPGENVISLSHFEVTVSYPRSVSSTSNDPVLNRRAFPVCSFVKGSHPYVQLSSCHFMYSYFIAAYIYPLTVVACSYNLKLMQNFGRRQCPPLEGVLPSLKIILCQGVLAGSFLFVVQTVVFYVLMSAVLPVLQKNITSLFFLPEVRTFPTLQRKRVCRSLSSVVLFLGYS